MANLPEVIFFSLVGGVFSLVGGVFLLSRAKAARVLAVYATPFAAGALLAAAFMDLLKEGAHTTEPESVLQWALAGILIFFLLESVLSWFHHHHQHEEQHRDPSVSLIIIGDTVHNFIDGAAIAAAFLLDVSTGIVATLAVAAHEIPQEIGDFGLMLHKGMRRRNVLLVNLVSALATTLAAIIFFAAGRDNDALIGALLGLAAGFFIYIAVSDIIPSIHESQTQRELNLKSLLLLIGVLVVGLATTMAHQYIDTDHHQAEPPSYQNDEL